MVDMGLRLNRRGMILRCIVDMDLDMDFVMICDDLDDFRCDGAI